MKFMTSNKSFIKSSNSPTHLEFCEGNNANKIILKRVYSLFLQRVVSVSVQQGARLIHSGYKYTHVVFISD